jgi:hypothetical protein
MHDRSVVYETLATKSNLPSREGGIMGNVRIAAFASAVVAVILVARAHAEIYCTDLGCSSIGGGGYVLVVDGAAGNPDPADGYILVEADGRVCFADMDGPYSDTSPDDGNPRAPSERCLP